MKDNAVLRPGQLYFAYGCNMDADLLQRTLGVDLADGWAARLDDWRVDFNLRDADGTTVANLVSQEACRTYGVVYRLPRDGLAALNEFEGFPELYRHETVWVEPSRTRARQAALTYVGEEQWLGGGKPPRPEYLEHVLSGARAHSLPDAYVRWLERRARGHGPECFQE